MAYEKDTNIKLIFNRLNGDQRSMMTAIWTEDGDWIENGRITFYNEKSKDCKLNLIRECVAIMNMLESEIYPISIELEDRISAKRYAQISFVQLVGYIANTLK